MINGRHINKQIDLAEFNDFISFCENEGWHKIPKEQPEQVVLMQNGCDKNLIVLNGDAINGNACGSEIKNLFVFGNSLDMALKFRAARDFKLEERCQQLAKHSES